MTMITWELIAAMIVGGFLVLLGVLFGAAAALGSRNRETEDIDIP
jgi:hypothetical protein